MTPTPTIAEAKAQILDLIHRNGDASFANIMHLGEWTKGDLGWEITPDQEETNVYIWADMSQLLCDALQELRRENAIEPHPCHVLVYLADGMLLGMPIVKKRLKYADPHWLPVVLTIPKTESTKRKPKATRCASARMQ